jgi:two-component sensor histidine kinase
VTILTSSTSGKIKADDAISFGLIVTELVINALKHAFPSGRPGKITVDYRSQGEGWRLSVGDDGVGMSKAPSEAKAGLGTSIVEALARQLHAQVKVADAGPGTLVSIAHTSPAAIIGLVGARPVERAI